MPEFDPFVVSTLTGDEHFADEKENMPFKVLDFWRWSASNLLSKATRGVLAEFIVAKALEIDTRKCREEWASFDLETPCGVKVEVKSASYLQGWDQKQLSSILFGVKASRAWDYETNKRSESKARSADVYIFALLAHKDKTTINPLDLDQWKFYVLARRALDERARSQHSITLPSLQSLCGAPIAFSQIREAVFLADKSSR